MSIFQPIVYGFVIKPFNSIVQLKILVALKLRKYIEMQLKKSYLNLINGLDFLNPFQTLKFFIIIYIN